LGWICEAAGVDIRELTAQVEHISQVYATRFGIERDSNSRPD